VDFGTLPVSVVRLVDRICDEFEAALRAGKTPRIEEYLGNQPEPARSALLRALLAAELEARSNRGEHPVVEDYVRRFPADALLVRSVAATTAPTATVGHSPAHEDLVPDGSITRGISGSLSEVARRGTRWIWAWPLVAAAILGIAGFWANDTIKRVMRDQVASELLALRDADIAALSENFAAHQQFATIAASDPEVIASAQALFALRNADTATLAQSPEQAKLRSVLGPWLGQYEYDGFRVLSREGRCISSWRDITLGGPAKKEELECLSTVFAGAATISRPRASEVPLTDVDGNERLGLPTMFVLAPIRDKEGRGIAALGFRMRPERTFTRVLNVARLGRSGETFAFDRTGLLLSESRFDDDLKRIGLLRDSPHSRSSLSLELRNPGVDLTRGRRPRRPRREQPLTRLVTQALEGGHGVDVDGDRDYRGVPVIGAWIWLTDYDFGVITKVDKAEAFRPLSILYVTFWILMGLLAASAIALFVFTGLVARLGGRMRAADLVAKRFGRYTLEGKIGEGGMGVVYRAQHAMLRRPTAIKLLKPERTDEKSIARFEREVQLTSQLTHPNTITIFDYGRTSEGVFYYAMEYLDGIDLQLLAIRHGSQPDGRVIRILVQVCESLVEAHGVGLIHRDIKPSNIILTRRGGLCDFVKLVDFGLAKAIEPDPAAGVTPTHTAVGTPHYMAPEAIRTPERADARSDLYSVGAVGYFLLTGRNVFDGRSVGEILLKQVGEVPPPPSVRSGRAVAAELEAILMRCLAKDPAKRPASAAELAEALERVAVEPWTIAAAESWWQEYASAIPAPAPVSPGVAMTTVDVAAVR
jgi:eukaryotic-like serine/threonine-protein kinase